jgi:hypothetical protein
MIYRGPILKDRESRSLCSKLANVYMVLALLNNPCSHRALACRLVSTPIWCTELDVPLRLKLVQLVYMPAFRLCWTWAWIHDGVECKVKATGSFIARQNACLHDPEAWGEDKVLTSHMGVAYSAGLSKNSSLGDPDAVIPIMKVFPLQHSSLASAHTNTQALCRAWLATVGSQRSPIHGTWQSTDHAGPYDALQGSD